MTPRRPVRRRASRRGQALVELTLIIPILALLFMGVSTTATFLGDAQIAGQAIKAGARLAAEDGNAGYVAGTWRRDARPRNGGTGMTTIPVWSINRRSRPWSA